MAEAEDRIKWDKALSLLYSKAKVDIVSPASGGNDATEDEEAPAVAAREPEKETEAVAEALHESAEAKE
jgi:hypothetical protein